MICELGKARIGFANQGREGYVLQEVRALKVAP